MNRIVVKELRRKYPKGTRIKLVEMKDKQAVETGTIGTVNHVDDLGVIHVDWDNGRTLGVCLEEDTILKEREEEGYGEAFL